MNYVFSLASSSRSCWRAGLSKKPTGEVFFVSFVHVAVRRVTLWSRGQLFEHMKQLVRRKAEISCYFSLQVLLSKAHLWHQSARDWEWKSSCSRATIAAEKSRIHPTGTSRIEVILLETWWSWVWEVSRLTTHICLIKNQTKTSVMRFSLLRWTFRFDSVFSN